MSEHNEHKVQVESIESVEPAEQIEHTEPTEQAEQIELKERKLRDKSFFLANAKGEALPLSVEMALGKQFSDYRGWRCAIGTENLHISSDGEIYGAACRNNGHLGNVYNRDFQLPQEWHVCTRRSCSCGADMQLRKVKDERYIPNTYLDIPDNLVDSLEDPVYSAPVHQDIHRNHPLTLTWDLGRRCNYSCSYCSPAISNNFEAFRTAGSLNFAYEGLENFFLQGKKAKFVFTGGEPTINPKYLDFVKKLIEIGHLVHTTTNGSRNPEYYSELIELSFIGFSYHFEFAKFERFKKVVQAIIDKKLIHKVARDNWCGIRLMVPPGKYSEAEQVRSELISVPEFKEVGLMVFMSPCYENEDHTQMMTYNEEEINQINAFG